MLEPRGVSDEQATVLRQWAPDLQVLADWSWGLTDTVVLHARTGAREVVVKAAGPGNHHIGREIAAHRQWVAALSGRGRAPRLLWTDQAANLLVTEHLDGELVLGTRAEGDPSTYAQAGELLAVLHAQASHIDEDYERQQNARTLQWLDGPHRIDGATEVELRAHVADFPCQATVLVPTHGDWQPRNWLRHGDDVRVIDFGRADWRPAHTYFARLAAQQFRGRPDLEAAFVHGYGEDPREPGAWRRSLLREAVGTACWAHQVGDVAFEARGHEMVADVLRLT
ncbi:aminoglycoside phosphotransferase family protein [Pedococcus cremeus]|uniref:aminoglycoside phosphotransferase family protein n=1 Tax=Pedococcus cremeus TaxID=587636 RepID=UPI001FE0223F|nr:aminoglycoside phosphotransferase family protein [Pedococcus cremeus]